MSTNNASYRIEHGLCVAARVQTWVRPRPRLTRVSNNAPAEALAS